MRNGQCAIALKEVWQRLPKPTGPAAQISAYVTAGLSGFWREIAIVFRGAAFAQAVRMSTPYDIHERTFLFAVRIVEFCRDLTDAHPVTRKLSWQLLDAATSTGANLEEADSGQSRRDFIAKTGISRKEGWETVFWLRLIGATDVVCRQPTVLLLDEAVQIAKIISTRDITECCGSPE
jgi:four helix bundle protein